MSMLSDRWAVATWRLPLVRVLAFAVPLVACAVLAPFRDAVTAATSVLVLVLCVVAAAATGDRIAGLLAAASAGIWFDFFLTSPYLRFSIDDPNDIEAAVLLVLIGLLVTEVALWGHRQQARAARRAGYLDGVVETARVVAEGDLPPDALVDRVGRHISDVLEADSSRWVAGPVHDPRIATLDHDGTLTRAGRIVNVEREGMPTLEYAAVTVRRGDRVFGHFLLTSATQIVRPTRDQRRVAVVLADQLAGVLQDRGAS